MSKIDVNPQAEQAMLIKSRDDKYTIQSVENALDLLDALGECEEDIRIARLSERLNLGKAKVFRLMATLERRGYVERERTGIYHIGVSAFETAQKLLSRFTLLNKARPVMEALARTSGESVYLAIQRGQDILLVDMIDTLEQIKVVSLLGKRYPLTATALGQVFTLDEQDSGGFRSDQGSLGAGIACLAVPVRNAGGKVCGALSLIGPDFRFTQGRTEELLPPLRDAGELISSKIGFLGRYSPMA